MSHNHKDPSTFPPPGASGSTLKGQGNLAYTPHMFLQISTQVGRHCAHAHGFQQHCTV